MNPPHPVCHLCAATSLQRVVRAGKRGALPRRTRDSAHHACIDGCLNNGTRGYRPGSWRVGIVSMATATARAIQGEAAAKELHPQSAFLRQFLRVRLEV